MTKLLARYSYLAQPLLLAVLAIIIATSAAILGQHHEFAEAQAKGKTITSYMKPGRHFTQWDGYRYEEIIDGGYIYEKSDSSIMADPRTGELRLKNVVWYPLYPALGWLVAKATGLPAHVALGIISQVCAAAAAMIFYAYCRRRYRPDLGASTDLGAACAVGLMLMGPFAIFMYANFTESLFVLLLVTFLWLLDLKTWRGWWCAAAVAAIASSCRSQGVLLGPILALTFLVQAREVRPLTRWACAVAMGIIASLGLLAYMIYLYAHFGDPLVFMKAQVYWCVGINSGTLRFAMNPLHALANVWKHLGYFYPEDWPRLLESLAVIVPPVILLAGWRRLNLPLFLLGGIMWGLPYVSNSLAGSSLLHSNWMSMGRFMAVVLPLHMILGYWLARRPWVAYVVMGMSAGVFSIFAYLYGGGVWVG